MANPLTTAPTTTASALATPNPVNPTTQPNANNGIPQTSLPTPGPIPKPTQSLAEVLYGRMIPDDNSSVPASMLNIYNNSGLLNANGPVSETTNGKPILPDYVDYTPVYGSGAFTPQLGNMYQNYWTSIFYPNR